MLKSLTQKADLEKSRGNSNDKKRERRHTAKNRKLEASYRETLLRPEVGTQAQFKNKKPPATYRYDSSLDPSMSWDEGHEAREQGEALINQVLEAKTLGDAKAAAAKLKAMCSPFLNWAGKAERSEFQVPTLPMFIHERLSTIAIIDTLKGHRNGTEQMQLFADPQHSITDQVLKAYEHRDKWVNRMILGDSLVVMNSLFHWVPFEVIPFKASGGEEIKPRERRHHVHAIPSKEKFRVVFPRVEGYTQAIRNRITLDWEDEPRIFLDPMNIPPGVQMKARVSLNSGRPSLTGPGKLRDVSINPFRKKRRKQELVFELATDLTREATSRGGE